MKIILRPETPPDFPAIFHLLTQAFGQEAEAVLVSRLRNSEAFIPDLSLVAVCDDILAGHILFTRIGIMDEKQQVYPSLALAPMAVLPEFQRQGIGSKLISAGLEVAQTMGLESVIVLGHEHYYPRFGFLPADTWGIYPPFDVPKEVFMAIELVPGALAGVSGTVIYSQPFNSL